jgi:putative spermidine/putrescine transport system substrate-binding protein
MTTPSVLRAQSDSMVVVSSGGLLEDAYQESIYKPWTQKTGVKIIPGPNTVAKLKSMVEAKAVEWDVMQVDGAIAAQLARQNLLEPLDYSVIDKSEIIPGVAREYYLPSDISGTVIAWNTDALKGATPPVSWAQVWDLNRYSGKRGILKRASQTLEIALMADGVDKDKLYPLDVDRALKSLGKIKERIYWWESGAQGAQILIDGEVPIAMEWVGRVLVPKKGGAKVDFNLEQTLYSSDSWVVPKGVKNKKRSMAFIAFAVQAPQQYAFSKIMPFGPVNKKAVAMMDPVQLATSPSAPNILSKGMLTNFDWWADNNQKVSEEFNRWIISG